MQSCINCLYTDHHPFGLSFQEGFCLGCLTHQEKYSLNWDTKYEFLKEMADIFKTKSGVYDCVVPVFGDAEDYFTVETVLGLGLRPLIVSVNNFFYNDIGWYNLQNLVTHFDVDSLIYTPNFHVYRELVKTSLRKYQSVYLPALMLMSSFPVHVAKQRNIPVVIWGQQQALEQVGKFSHSDTIMMTKWSRKEHDLFGVDIDLLIGNGAQLNPDHLDFYHYPSIEKLNSLGITGIYLNNYLPWDPVTQNMRALTHSFKAQANHNTFDPYERTGSSVYYNIHDLLKFKRLGYRKVTDQLSREIRHGRITRSQAIEIEKKCQSPVYLKPFFDWLGVSESGYKWILDHMFDGYQHLITLDRSHDNKFLSAEIFSELVPATPEMPEKSFLTYYKAI